MDSIEYYITATGPRRIADWGFAQRVCPGEEVSGDRYLVRARPDGILLGVVDGLGHGREAADAAEAAVSAIRSNCGEPVDSLITRCHQALRRTRGAALSLASLSGTSELMSWLGVGNVEGVLVRANKSAVPSQENIMLFPGVAGYRLPSLRAVDTPVYPGDLLIFFSDGVRRDFLWMPILPQSPGRMAEAICARYHTGVDDALVLVARFTKGAL